MITFIECKTPGYPARTQENVVANDITLAFALDFNTRGEILTRELCTDYKKLYLKILLPATMSPYAPIDWQRMVNIVEYISRNTNQQSLDINVAGNGIYGLPYEQEQLDMWMKTFFVDFRMASFNLFTINSSSNGGQSGSDEAGGKATASLGIKTTVRAPFGWRFRNKQGQDISNETLFKQRFLI